MQNLEPGPVRSLVTGATGLLGSHIVERLVKRGDVVRALVRPESQSEFLKAQGVECVVGTLSAPESCAEAVREVDVVYHAAAKVGDWGSWEEYQNGVIEATRNIAIAASEAGVRRFVQISSTSAYGHPAEKGPPIDESAPLGQNPWWFWDYYTHSKVEAERLLWQMAEERGLQLTVIRPSLMFGERDRRITPRFIRRLRGRYRRLIGSGDNLISAVYAGAVADAVILAADDPGSTGEAYNVTDQGPITQREFFDHFAASCGAVPVRRRRPYWYGWALATILETHGRLTRRSRPPLISRYAIWVLGRRLTYSTDKVRQRLGWSPTLGYRESIERSVRWCLEEQARTGEQS